MEDNEREPIQQTTKKTEGPLSDKTLVRPQEDTDVYAGQKISSIFKVGEKFTVHRVQAEKLIADGKAYATEAEAKAGKIVDLGSD